MKKIRIGNDISVTWSIKASGEPYNLSGKRLKLFLTSPNSVKMEIQDFSVSGNVLSFTFYGKDQKVPGIYTLTLIENRGETGMISIDNCNAFQLVDWSCMTSKDIMNDLMLESDTAICVVHPVPPEIGENGNWFVEGEDTGKRSYGLSAYELAVKHGFEGTEEEWLGSLAGSGIGEVTAEAVALASDSAPAVQVEKTAAGDAVNLHFVFGIPVPSGGDGHVGFSQSEIVLPSSGDPVELQIISNLEWKIS